MSGIVGGINLRSSGLVNISSAADGQVFTGTGAGLPVGFEAAAGGGKILQVISATKTDTASSTSLTFANVSGLSVAITCAATSSKILILATVPSQGNASSGVAYIRLAVGGSALCVGDASGSKDRVSGSYMGTNNSTETCSINFLHSPSSTSEQTYTIQHASGGSYTTYVNRNKNDVDAAGTPRTASTITCIEVGA